MTVLEDILAKGEVEEELLVELSDEQKVVLFYKIRQEQIKRWDKHYNDISDESKQITIQRFGLYLCAVYDRMRIYGNVDGVIVLYGNESDGLTASCNKSPGKTNFLKGRDGNEWVWVMGDAPGDENYDQIWVKYALQYAEMEVARQQKQRQQFLAAVGPTQPEVAIPDNAAPAQQESEQSTEPSVNKGSIEKGLEETTAPSKETDMRNLDIVPVDEQASIPVHSEAEKGVEEPVPRVPDVIDQTSVSAAMVPEVLPLDSTISISTLSEQDANHSSGQSVDITLDSESRLTPTLENEANQIEEKDDFNFVDDDDEEDEDGKFPVDRDDNLEMLESVSNQNVSDSSDENMPFPVAQLDSEVQSDVTASSDVIEPSSGSQASSEAVVSENLGSVQERMRMFGPSAKFQPKSRNVQQAPAIPLYRPMLPLTGNRDSASDEFNFPMVTDTRATTIETPRYNVTSPNQVNNPQMNFEANFGRFNAYNKPAPVQPPMYRPTYNGNNPTRPYYAPPRDNLANNERQQRASGGYRQSPDLVVSSNMSNNLTPLPRNYLSPSNSSQNGSSGGNSTFDFNQTGSSNPGSNFSSLNRTANSSTGQIKTNPYARPPHNSVPVVPHPNGKPIVPPRNMKSYPHLNPPNYSPNSPGSETPPLTSINLDASVSQLIAKQNVMVQRFLRQSIIRDEEQANKLQADWEESERKAKQQDEKLKRENERYREMARRVINEQLPVPLSRAFLLSSDKSDEATGPQNRQEVIQWFQREELDQRAGCDPESGAICLWFHGIINRNRAEQLLASLPVGSFLIRVSEKIFGYTLSYKSDGRCKHFLIDKHDGTYQFFGLNMKRHNCLFDLVNYHRTKPVSASGNELLLYPVGQVNGQPLDYAELFQRNLTISSHNSNPVSIQGGGFGHPNQSNGGFGMQNANNTFMVDNNRSQTSSANTFSYPNRNLALATRF